MESPQGERRKVDVLPEKNPEMEGLRFIGISPDSAKVVVESVSPTSPADRAGFLKGDVIQSVNQETAFNLERISYLVKRAHVNKESISFKVLRNGSEREIRLAPVLPYYLDQEGKRIDFEKPMIGLGWDIEYEGYKYIAHPSPLVQVGNSATLVYKTLKALVSKKSGRWATTLDRAGGYFGPDATAAGGGSPPFAELHGCFECESGHIEFITDSDFGWGTYLFSTHRGRKKERAVL